MTMSRTGPTKRVGAMGIVVAALGLLLGMALVAPAGAQDDPYTGVESLDLAECPEFVPGLTLVSGEVAPGSDFVVGGDGYAANAPINLYVCSTPIKVGTGTADASGAFTAPGSIPADLEAGGHDLFAYGIGADGEPRLIGLQFDVEETPSTPSPPSPPGTPTGERPARQPVEPRARQPAEPRVRPAQAPPVGRARRWPAPASAPRFPRCWLLRWWSVAAC